MIKIVIFKEPQYFINRDYSPKRPKSDESFRPCVSSLKRTKTLVQDIVLCNDFELFCTFTFNPAKVDRFNYVKCQSMMRKWLHHQQDRSREAGKKFNYLVIPEQHKSGAWHFHALLSGYCGSLKDSGVRTKSLNKIYNITSFRSGFTTASFISDKKGVSSYVTKYITKDFIRKFNKKRFFASYGLIRPVKRVNSDILSKTLFSLRKKVSEDLYTESYILPIDY